MDHMLRLQQLHDHLFDDDLLGIITFLNHGLSVDTCLNGKSLLTIACEYNSENIANFLIANKANLNFKDTNGNDALMWAIGMGMIETAKLLISNNCQLDCVNKEGESALSTAIKSNQFDLISIMIKALYTKNILNTLANNNKTIFDFLVKFKDNLAFVQLENSFSNLSLTPSSPVIFSQPATSALSHVNMHSASNDPFIPFQNYDTYKR